MPRTDIQPLAAAGAALTEATSDLISQLNHGQDLFPPVFTPSRWIARTEMGAARCVVPLLQPGELSVGVSVDIEPAQASSVRPRARLAARRSGTKGKLCHFESIAHDERGRTESRKHACAIARSGRLVERAMQRGGVRS
jgi:fluoroacetyl-CoA thioesterase